MVRRINLRFAWWMPLALASTLIAAAPFLLALGAGAAMGVYALAALALLTASVALLARAERRRLRCDAR